MEKPGDSTITVRPSSTRKMVFGCGSLYVVIDEVENRPFRVFLKKGHTGLCNQALLEAVGRLLTIIIQASDISLDRVWRTLVGINCDKGKVDQLSCMDALARMLKAEYSAQVDVAPEELVSPTD